MDEDKIIETANYILGLDGINTYSTAMYLLNEVAKEIKRKALESPVKK